MLSENRCAQCLAREQELGYSWCHARDGRVDWTEDTSRCGEFESRGIERKGE